MSKRRKFSAEFKRRPKRVRAWREQGRLSCRRTWRRKNESLVERLHRDSASRCALWPFVLRSSHVSPLPGRYAYWIADLGLLRGDLSIPSTVSCAAAVVGKLASKAIGVHRSVMSFAPKNKSPNGRLVLFRGRFTGVQVKAYQSPHQLLEKLRSLQFPRGLRVLITLSLAMGLPGCRDEVESSTYPIGQTGETCTAYKGFDRQPPEVVVAELAKRGLIVAGWCIGQSAARSPVGTFCLQGRRSIGYLRQTHM